MYTDYTNNYDTSHVAYSEGLTVEEQQAEWAIFVTLQRPQQDISTTPTNCQASTTTTLHTYSLNYIPSYIFPSTTSSHPSAPTTSSSPIFPSDTISSREPELRKDKHDAADTHDLVQEMLNPLIHNTDADAKQMPPPAPSKEWIENVYTFQDLQTQVNLCTWTGEMQKQGIMMIDIMDVRTLTRFISKSMWCWTDDHPRKSRGGYEQPQARNFSLTTKQMGTQPA